MSLRKVAGVSLSIIAKSGLPVFAKNDAKAKTLSKSFVGSPTQTCLGPSYSNIGIIRSISETSDAKRSFRAA